MNGTLYLTSNYLFKIKLGMFLIKWSCADIHIFKYSNKRVLEFVIIWLITLSVCNKNHDTFIRYIQNLLHYCIAPIMCQISTWYFTINIARLVRASSPGLCQHIVLLSIIIYCISVCSLNLHEISANVNSL